MKRIGIIDVGSNSARLVIMEIDESKGSRLAYNQKDPLRLALKTDKNGYLTEEAFSATVTCLRGFASMCHFFHTDEIIAVATAAIRNAKNGAKLVKSVREKTGIDLEIISGKTEAYLSYLGVINTINVKDAVIFDLGGGSTEVILVRDRKLVDSISLPIGCVNLTKASRQNGTNNAEDMKIMNKLIADQLSKTPWLDNCGLPLVGVGGTARSIGKVEEKRQKYFTAKLHNFQFDLNDFKDWYKSMASTAPPLRRRIPGLSSDRADVILAGSSIIKGIADKAKSKKFIISGCGLREGLFCQYLHQHTSRPLIIPDILKESQNDMIHMYCPDEQHGRLVAKFAMELFRGWQRLHQLDPNRWGPLLETAALLHDSGITINFYNHTRHSGYIIENSRLFGLSHMDVVFASIIAAWHHGINRTYLRNKPYRKLLTENDILDLSKAALLLAMAECLDYTQSGVVENIEARVNSGMATLTLIARVDPAMELSRLNAMMKWIRKTLGCPLTLLVKAGVPKAAPVSPVRNHVKVEEVVNQQRS
jgi:exopolyphosphatase/guanosine-5'-triphosphate,3'-diphosphate pyrophosphatase